MQAVCKQTYRRLLILFYQILRGSSLHAVCRQISGLNFEYRICWQDHILCQKGRLNFVIFPEFRRLRIRFFLLKLKNPEIRKWKFDSKAHQIHRTVIRRHWGEIYYRYFALRGQIVSRKYRNFQPFYTNSFL